MSGRLIGAHGSSPPVVKPSSTVSEASSSADPLERRRPVLLDDHGEQVGRVLPGGAGDPAAGELGDRRAAVRVADVDAAWGRGPRRTTSPPVLRPGRTGRCCPRSSSPDEVVGRRRRTRRRRGGCRRPRRSRSPRSASRPARWRRSAGTAAGPSVTVPSEVTRTVPPSSPPRAVRTAIVHSFGAVAGDGRGLGRPDVASGEGARLVGAGHEQVQGPVRADPGDRGPVRSRGDAAVEREPVQRPAGLVDQGRLPFAVGGR